MKKKILLLGSVLFVGGVSTVLMLVFAAPEPAPASNFDWPEWRGANHDNVSKETDLLKSWPQGGPKLLWTFKGAGFGYSGPAIVGDRLYVMGGDKNNDFVLAVDAGKGEKLWSMRIGPYVHNGYGSGPRGTPTVDGDYLYALSSGGALTCLKTKDGKRVWSVNLTGKEGLGGGRPVWNYSESPLVDGEQVICTPGGSQGTMAALDKKTGKVLWRSTKLTDPAGYSSAVPVTIGGVRQYVQLTMKGVAGVAAKDGSLLWYYRHPKYKVAVIPSPIVRDNYVYAVAGYGAGGVLLKLTPEGDGVKVEQLYDEQAMRVMDNKHEGVVLLGDYVYGWSDQNRGCWMCQELKTGKKMWESKALGKGSLTSAGGMLYCYSEDAGAVALVAASPDGWKEVARFTIPEKDKGREGVIYKSNVWTHPVLANGRLYLRDQDLIYCYQVK